jgi:hypothetical protein
MKTRHIALIVSIALAAGLFGAWGYNQLGEPKTGAYETSLEPILRDYCYYVVIDYPQSVKGQPERPEVFVVDFTVKSKGAPDKQRVANAFKFGYPYLYRNYFDSERHKFRKCSGARPDKQEPELEEPELGD